MCVRLLDRAKISRVTSFDSILYKLSSLSFHIYSKEIHSIALIGSPHLWMSNEFDCEFISSNKAELLTCWKVNNSNIEHIIHFWAYKWRK